MLTDAKSLFGHLQKTGSITKERQTTIDLLVRDEVGAFVSHAGGQFDERDAHDGGVQVVPGKWQVRVAPDCQGS